MKKMDKKEATRSLPHLSVWPHGLHRPIHTEGELLGGRQDLDGGKAHHARLCLVHAHHREVLAHKVTRQQVGTRPEELVVVQVEGCNVLT